ncbi:MAG: retropepsin-like aspartic protease [Kangiellaceae bacterium]|jgi:aspartyl protease family protein|nr:retropepsin-like aspartic protease [Kangiellaceae bacterium]
MVFRTTAGLVLATLFSLQVSSQELAVNVLGLLKNAAIIEINGEQRILKLNKQSPEGIRLKSANSLQAVVEYKGKEYTLKLGQASPTSFNSAEQKSAQTPSKKGLTLIRQRDNMFRVRGTINGISVNFLVDTGATMIAMNHHTANKIGIAYRAEGKVIRTATASGIINAYEVMLDKVRVGDLELPNVRGAVIVGDQPSAVLLGMSFLDKYKVKQDGNRLSIQSRIP